MAWKTQKGLSTSATNSERVLYWIYQFLASYLPANFPGRLSMPYSGNGGGNWLSEAGPLDNSYVIIQPTSHAWGDGTRWQLLICARHTAGASTVAGVGGAEAIPGPSLWAMFSPSGGWDDVTKRFTALNTDPMVALCQPNAPVNILASNLAINCYERMNGVTPDGVVFQLWGDKGKDGTWDMGISAGHSRWFNPSYAKPHQFFVGMPQASNAAWTWGQSGAAATVCQVENPAGVGFNPIGAEWGAIMDTRGLVEGSGDWGAIPVPFFDLTTSRVVGWAQGFWRHDDSTADGTEDSTHSYVCYNGLLFPTNDP